MSLIGASYTHCLPKSSQQRVLFTFIPDDYGTVACIRIMLIPAAPTTYSNQMLVNIGDVDRPDTDRFTALVIHAAL